METFPGDIVQAAIDGVLVLTVNDRLARHLRRQVDTRMRELERSAWRTPEIFAFQHWLSRLGDRWGIAERMLSPEQSLHLWEMVIDEDLAENGAVLMRTTETALQAQKAHHLLEQYRAVFRSGEGGEDHQAFLRWRASWQGALRKAGWEDPSRLAELLGRQLEAGRPVPATTFILAGFDDLTPAHRALLELLENRGCRVYSWEPDGRSEGRRLLAGCLDIRDEVRRCARWIRRLLDEGGARIGVIAPELDVYKTLIERVFREELAPSSLLPGGEGEKAFNLSLGSPLATEGMVVAALEILAVGTTVPLDRLSFLLRSPFIWGHLAEQHGRGLFDAELRTLRMTELPLERLIRLTRKGLKKGGRVDIFAGFLETLAQGLEERGRRSPGFWASHFADLLEALRWPGDRTLDSRGYQVFGAWKELLQTMGSLDVVAKPVDRSQALALLRRLARQKLFQAEGSGGRVQVMGTLEAAGLEFDHLWVLGMHEEAFPPPAKPNPFIPLTLQRRLGMPRADAIRELDFAGKVAARLLASAPDVVVSYPRQFEGQGLQASPLFHGLAEGEPSLAEGRHPAELIVQQAPCPERLVDESGPALPAGKKIKGGTSILKDQALCPFRAFARHRLHAEGLAKGVLGLDGLDRGSLVHDALEFFWDLTRDLSSLQSLSVEKLQRRIAECVARSLEKLERERQLSIPPGLRENEAARLAALVAEWLVIEQERAGFTVECLETWHRANLGQLSIQTRLDRIDRLEDGSRVIIDYKTGRPAIRDWLGERPLEPQLPLYGLGQKEQELAAVAFARVRGSGCAFVGVARVGGLLPGIPTFQEQEEIAAAGIRDWQDLLTAWRKSLHRLAEEFSAGLAAVDPINREKACDRCDLHSLCRIGDPVGIGDD